MTELADDLASNPRAERRARSSRAPRTNQTDTGRESLPPSPVLLVNNPIVFLDFDGVLSKGLTADFRHLPVFENWLRKRQAVQVVISSNWRLEMSLEALRGLFSPDVAGRVIGVTPEDHEARLKRQVEILSWRLEAGHDGPFVAIDDNAHDFEVAYPNVVETSRHGLTEEHLQHCDRVLGLT